MICVDPESFDAVQRQAAVRRRWQDDRPPTVAELRRARRQRDAFAIVCAVLVILLYAVAAYR